MMSQSFRWRSGASICACARSLAFPRRKPNPPPHRRLLDPVVVTAARSPQRLDQLLADVTVIGPEEIARAGAQSLADLLQRQPGVQIVTNGGPGSTTGVFLRGANADQTLVLIDGLRVSSSSSGTTPFEAIPLDQIDHIEILRGPAASLYGADAIGGVIQMFTRKGGDTFAANASAGYGTYNTSQFAAGASGEGGPWRFMVQGGYNQSSGFNAIGNPANFSYNPDRDGYRNGSASGVAGLHLRSGAGALGPGLLQPHECAVRWRAGFRRSHHHDGAELRGGQSQSSDVVLEKHARSRRVDRRQQYADRLRSVAVQDDAATVHLAERFHRRARRGAVGRADATRGETRYRRRLPHDLA